MDFLDPFNLLKVNVKKNVDKEKDLNGILFLSIYSLHDN